MKQTNRKKTERFNKVRAYADMIRGDADMSSFRRAPYYLASAPVHRSRSCTMEFPCSVGDVVYEAYAGRAHPMTVTGFGYTIRLLCAGDGGKQNAGT